MLNHGLPGNQDEEGGIFSYISILDPGLGLGFIGQLLCTSHTMTTPRHDHRYINTRLPHSAAQSRGLLDCTTEGVTASVSKVPMLLESVRQIFVHKNYSEVVADSAKPRRPAVKLFTLSPYAVFFPSLFDLMPLNAKPSRHAPDTPAERCYILLISVL